MGMCGRWRSIRRWGWRRIDESRLGLRGWTKTRDVTNAELIRSESCCYKEQAICLSSLSLLYAAQQRIAQSAQ